MIVAVEKVGMVKQTIFEVQEKEEMKAMQLLSLVEIEEKNCMTVMNRFELTVKMII